LKTQRSKNRSKNERTTLEPVLNAEGVGARMPGARTRGRFLGEKEKSPRGEKKSIWFRETTGGKGDMASQGSAVQEGGRKKEARKQEARTRGKEKKKGTAGGKRKDRASLLEKMVQGRKTGGKSKRHLSQTYEGRSRGAGGVKWRQSKKKKGEGKKKSHHEPARTADLLPRGGGGGKK